MFPLTMYPDGHLQQNERTAARRSTYFNIRDSTLIQRPRRELFSAKLHAPPAPGAVDNPVLRQR
jgi:hypothetical protein